MSLAAKVITYSKPKTQTPQTNMLGAQLLISTDLFNPIKPGWGDQFLDNFHFLVSSALVINLLMDNFSHDLEHKVILLSLGPIWYCSSDPGPGCYPVQFTGESCL